MAGRSEQQVVQDAIARAAAAYGTNPRLLTHIAKRESGMRFRGGVFNRWDSNAKKGIPSAGTFQFIEPTFKSFAPQARKANPAAWEGVPMEWLNPYAQALTAAWAFRAGHGKHWATYDPVARGMPIKGPRTLLKPAQGARAASGGAVDISVSLPGAAPAGPDPGVGRKAAALSMIFADNPAMQGLIAERAAKAQQEPVDAAAPITVSARVARPGRNSPAGQGGNPLAELERRFGLRRSSTDNDRPGVHVTGSNHYQKAPWGGVRAYDYGTALNNPKKLAAAHRWLLQNPRGVRESFWDPAGRYVKNGSIVRGAIGGHSDHLHVAY